MEPETNRVEFEAEELRRSLPLDATDKLIRYETHLDCQLYRAIHILACEVGFASS